MCNEYVIYRCYFVITYKEVEKSVELQGIKFYVFSRANMNAKNTKNQENQNLAGKMIGLKVGVHI